MNFFCKFCSTYFFLLLAAIGKILELHGPSVKIDLVAHCVGGLAIHIALMGGHVSANHIASLSCTNSSMFFKITVSSRVKMCLPLIPVSIFFSLFQSDMFADSGGGWGVCYLRLF